MKIGLGVFRFEIRGLLMKLAAAHSLKVSRVSKLIKKCPLMQSGSSFTTVDDAFDKGICQKQEKPSSKLTFSKFEISKTFLNIKMNLFCNCNSQQ